MAGTQRFTTVQDLVDHLDEFDGDGQFRYEGAEGAIAHDNRRRAGFAVAAVRAYQERTSFSDEEIHVVLGDLLGDLRHLADVAGVDFDDVLEAGRQYYANELEGRP